MASLETLHLALGIFLLPACSFLLMALFHHKLPRHGDWLATGVLGVCLFASLVILFRAVSSASGLLVNFTFDWLPLKTGLTLSGGLMVDGLTATMLVVVSTVSFLVHLFSSKYLEGDIRYGRYYCGLLLFTTSMLGLVLANSLLFLFIFWELVGLSSYLLIGHWFEKKSASNAAIKAFLTTRIGDLGMFVGLMICYVKVGSLEYADLFAAVQTGTLSGSWQTIAGLGIFFGAMGKSAQVPLHVWLPDAMEGPTPVSALIHAATMVAAGVYLTGRLLPLFNEETLLIIAYVGGFTAFFAATIAIVQDDIKRVLAYSTVSQLGYMILALGVGGYVSGLFHLTTHAFFKAGLFLGSGAVIHAMHHEQSMSKYGGLFKKLPITAVCYLLATLALVGVPPFAGFFSKDAILADVLAFSQAEGHWFLPIAGFTTVALTAFYMTRQYLLTFTGKPRDQHAYEHAHEVPWQMYSALIVLAVLALSSGWGTWFSDLNPKKTAIEQLSDFSKHGYTSTLMQEALTPSSVFVPQSNSSSASHPAPSNGAPTSAHASSGAEHHGSAHTMAMILSVSLGALGIILGLLFYLERRSGQTVLSAAKVALKLRRLYLLLWHKYYFDELYECLFLLPIQGLSKTAAWFDKYIIDSLVNFVGLLAGLGAKLVEAADRVFVDGVLVMGSASTTARIGEGTSALQTGVVRQYLLFSVCGIVVISLLLSLFL